MSYQTAQRFLQKYGQDKLFWLRASMNEHMMQMLIARELGLSEARVSQMLPGLGRWNWDFTQPTIDALKFELSVKKRDAAMIREVIREHEKETHLRLISVEAT